MRFQRKTSRNGAPTSGYFRLVPDEPWRFHGGARCIVSRANACSCAQRLDELRDARDIIVQLQRELERARGVIADQQAVVNVLRTARGGRR